MNIVTLLPFIVLIGAMFLMTRSAKNKQRQAAQMRDTMQPGTGVRTIGGMYATVKEVHDDTVLLEVAPAVHAIYAKNAIGAVLSDAEYNHIVHGIDPDDSADEAVDGADTPVVPDDASSLTTTPAGGADSADAAKAAGEPEGEKADAKKIDLGKNDADAADAPEDEKRDGGADAK
ncbi:preprotein translocase subunit YajC [Streptomyces sp. Rer75]|uniref:preprotein translocase subunit YajC n=1 Tax=unclassified Streptomyces TaxID=2593676 RepID=UPI0015CFB52C|nr:preprotein translocase subunit YajC [Streptomyces sp. Rer75]QLH25217.1 preprotein translocase subunit YajC [Streptomyces sp. Rer75]